MAKLTQAQRRALEAAKGQAEAPVLQRLTMGSFIIRHDIGLRTWRSLARRGYVETPMRDGWSYPFLTEAGRKALEGGAI